MAMIVAALPVRMGGHAFCSIEDRTIRVLFAGYQAGAIGIQEV